MNTRYTQIKANLVKSPKRWLITGAAGFIGSNLVETLLSLEQTVVGLDNFSTGHRSNLADVQTKLSPERWARFQFIEGDITNATTCAEAMHGVDIILHQAALGSVTRSIEDPLKSNTNNVTGFVNMLWSAKEANIKRFVYASSSAVYGDHPSLPKIEAQVGKVLSPYALTKKINEQYAEIFAATYGMPTIGLRYFNVFGQRQDPNGPYAAVIPLWFKQLLEGKPVYINGDGETSRDFCYIENVISANILAAMCDNENAWNQVYNVAAKDRTSLNQLFHMIRNGLVADFPQIANLEPTYREFRKGDVRHSLADIEKAQKLLGYDVLFTVSQGIAAATGYYKQKLLSK